MILNTHLGFGSNWDLVNSRVPFALMHHLEQCAILVEQMFGSNWDLVDIQVPFAFQESFLSTSNPI